MSGSSPLSHLSCPLTSPTMSHLLVSTTGTKAEEMDGGGEPGPEGCGEAGGGGHGSGNGGKDQDLGNQEE